METGGEKGERADLCTVRRFSVEPKTQNGVVKRVWGDASVTRDVGSLAASGKTGEAMVTTRRDWAVQGIEDGQGNYGSGRVAMIRINRKDELLECRLLERFARTKGGFLRCAHTVLMRLAVISAVVTFSRLTCKTSVTTCPPSFISRTSAPCLTMCDRGDEQSPIEL